MGKKSTTDWLVECKLVKIKGEVRYLWQAVDGAGEVLDFYVTETRDEAAALRFLKKALKHHGNTEMTVTDSEGPIRHR